MTALAGIAARSAAKSDWYFQSDFSIKWIDYKDHQKDNQTGNRGAFAPRFPYRYEQNCKPGSVFDSHLSWRAVAGALQPPREQPGRPWGPARNPRSHTGVAPDRVYSDGRFHAVGCALTAPFHPYLIGAGADGAVYLCCTFPEIALGGRYPLSLPCGARTFLT